jgi:hydrogenase 3 maturation protease
MLEELKNMLSGKVVVVGVGNTDKGDDGAGSVLARKLGAVPNFPVFDASVSPENFLEKIVQERPDTVLLIDAADFGGAPGEAKLFDAGDIGPGGLSTHALSLDMTREYLTGRLPGVKVVLLAIQPASVEGSGLSPAVRETCGEIERVLAGIRPPA